MIPVFGCETACELLEAFVDGELPTAQQVAVEAHVRWCRTCRARIEDMSLIGWSIRTGPAGEIDSAPDMRALAVMQSGVLARVRAEREQSLRLRLSEWCGDRRLIWAAMGATAAMILCLIGAANVWRLTTMRGVNSFAAQLDSAYPGSDQNPLSVEDARSAPHVLHDGLVIDVQPEGERMFMVAALVTQGGRVGATEVLDLPDAPSTGNRSLAFDDGHDVLDKMRTWQLTPAQSRQGRPVAVRVLYLFEQTTAVKESARWLDWRVAPPAPPVEPVKEPALPTGTRSAIEGSSATA
jgi:hypothetical protein